MRIYRMVKIFKTFLKYNNETKLLFIEAYIFLGWARVQKRMPFKKLVPKLGVKMRETPFDHLEVNKKTLAQISQVIQIASRYTLWESQCLVKAIAAMKMLERRHIDSTLYLGTGTDETGSLIAHAWLRSGPYYITGSEGKERFTVVGTFANNS